MYGAPWGSSSAAICSRAAPSSTPTGRGYFAETRRNLQALRTMDESARAEIAATVARTRPELRETVLELFRFGVGAQTVLPALKQYVDLSKIDEGKVAAVATLLEKAHAYQLEKRALGGILPDLVGAGRRNRLRLGLEATLADGLVADLAAILSMYRRQDSVRPMPSKVPGLDRLLLVLDDYESLDATITTFLADHLVPRLARASFETLIVVLGRDRLSDTHPVWKQRHELRFAGEVRLSPWTREEAETFLRGHGVTNDLAVTRILDDTEGYPYLLAGEVEAELDGGSTALGLKNFYERNHPLDDAGAEGLARSAQLPRRGERGDHRQGAAGGGSRAGARLVQGGGLGALAVGQPLGGATHPPLADLCLLQDGLAAPLPRAGGTSARLTKTRRPGLATRPPGRRRA